MKEAELSDYIIFFKKNIWLILGFTLFGAAIGLIFSSQPKLYQSSSLLYIFTEREKEEGEFSFEGFYASERARNFTDTAQAILSSYEYQKEILGSPKILVKKISPQLLRVSYKDRDKNEVLPTLDEFVKKTQGKISLLEPKDPPLKISPITEVSQPAEIFPKTSLNIIVGLLLGFVFGLILTSFLSYFRKGIT